MANLIGEYNGPSVEDVKIRRDIIFGYSYIIPCVSDLLPNRIYHEGSFVDMVRLRYFMKVLYEDQIHVYIRKDMNYGWDMVSIEVDTDKYIISPDGEEILVENEDPFTINGYQMYLGEGTGFIEEDGVTLNGVYNMWREDYFNMNESAPPYELITTYEVGRSDHHTYEPSKSCDDVEDMELDKLFNYDPYL